jgi:hypothetical protein
MHPPSCSNSPTTSSAEASASPRRSGTMPSRGSNGPTIGQRVSLRSPRKYTGRRMATASANESAWDRCVEATSTGPCLRVPGRRHRPRAAATRAATVAAINRTVDRSPGHHRCQRRGIALPDRRVQALSLPVRLTQAVKMRAEFCPPNPIDVDSTASSATSRGAPATTSRSISGSWSTRFAVGGTDLRAAPDGERGLDGTSGTKHVAGDALCRGDRKRVGVLPNTVCALPVPPHVVERCRGAVRVDVPDGSVGSKPASSSARWIASTAPPPSSGGAVA